MYMYMYVHVGTGIQRMCYMVYMFLLYSGLAQAHPVNNTSHGYQHIEIKRSLLIHNVHCTSAYTS